MRRQDSCQQPHCGAAIGAVERPSGRRESLPAYPVDGDIATISFDSHTQFFQT